MTDIVMPLCQTGQENLFGVGEANALGWCWHFDLDRARNRASPYRHGSLALTGRVWCRCGSSCLGPSYSKSWWSLAWGPYWRRRASLAYLEK